MEDALQGLLSRSVPGGVRVTSRQPCGSPSFQVIDIALPWAGQTLNWQVREIDRLVA